MAWNRQYPQDFTLNGVDIEAAFKNDDKELKNAYALLNRLRKMDAGPTPPNDPDENSLWLDKTSGIPTIRCYDSLNNKWSDVMSGSNAPAGYGLGTSAENISGKDLNGINLCGWYRGASCANAPNGGTGWFYYQVISHDSTHVVQIAWEMYQYANGQYGRMYSRRLADSGNWEAWRQIPTIDLVAPSNLGIGGTIPILSYVDVFSGTVNNSGRYYCISCTNTPEPVNGYLDVMIVDSATAIMRYTIYSGNTYEIKKVSGNWGAWKLIFSVDRAAYVVQQVVSGKNGYKLWSDGLIEQWGYFTTSPVTFPRAFTDVSTITVDINYQYTSAAGSAPNTPYPYSVSTTGFSCVDVYTGGTTYRARGK